MCLQDLYRMMVISLDVYLLYFCKTIFTGDFYEKSNVQISSNTLNISAINIFEHFKRLKF